MSERIFHIDEFNSIEKDGRPDLSGNYLVISNDYNIFVAFLNVTGDWTATGGRHYGDLHKTNRVVTHYLPGRLQVSQADSEKKTKVKFGKLVRASMVVPK